LDNLIKTLKDKVYIKKKLFLGNRIFYKNKTQGIFIKNNKKTKNKKIKYPYYLQENPRYNFFYIFWNKYRKTKKIKEINKKKIRIKENKKYYKIKTKKILEKTKY
jgi:hypothetical protein